MISLGGRFEQYVTRALGCHQWRGYVNEKGYGYLMVGSRTDGTRRVGAAHRVAWECGWSTPETTR